MPPIPPYSLIHLRQKRSRLAGQSLRRRAARAGLGCGAAAALVVLAFILMGSLAYTRLVTDLPAPETIARLLNPTDGALLQPTRLYDRTGQQVLLSLENVGISRHFLSIDPSQPNHLSPELIRATVGVLEPGYWQSSGVRLSALTDPQPQTIAERLVDDLLLWDEAPGLLRALRMRFLAAQVMARYGHAQVLEWYLNSASYGHLAYGAESAARLYLGVSAAQVDLPQAALLVAANTAPALNPLDAPDSALEHQQTVLMQLHQRGVIPVAEYQRAAVQKLRLAVPAGTPDLPAASFTRLVVDRLSEMFGRARVERGGLRVVTTLDMNLQMELTCTVHTQLARLAGLSTEARLPDGKPCTAARLLPTLPLGSPRLPKDVQASAVLMDPQTGQVLALLGDTTLQGESTLLSTRAPGTLLTPFVAVAAFARGVGPASLGWDVPSADADQQSTNPAGSFHGPVRLRVALANDYLAPQEQLLSQIGAANVWRLSSALGLSSLADAQSPALLRTGGAVSPLEMAQAYGVFANLGLRSGQSQPAGELLPALVFTVEDLRGMLWWDGRQSATQAVLSPQLAYLVHNILSDDSARRASLGYPNALEIGRPAGSKMGQGIGGGQVWTAGYTPRRVAVVSLTLNDPSPVVPLEKGMAAGIWHAMMQYVSQPMPPTGWAEPAGISHVEVCDPSGLLPTETCPNIVSEIFLSGNEPNGPDTLYRTFQINRETGRLATVFTPAALVEEKTFLVAPPEARDWARQANLPLPPQEYDAIQPPVPSVDARITSPALFTYVHGTVNLQGSASTPGLRFYQVQVGQGLNPQNWLQIGADQTTPMTNGVLGAWDTTQGPDGLYSIRLLVVHADQSAETAALQVTVDNTLPDLRILYPQEGQSLAPGMVTLQAEGQDAFGIQRVTWQVDGVSVGETIQPPYAFAWQATAGAHVLVARAVDLAGNESQSPPVHFQVP